MLLPVGDSPNPRGFTPWVTWGLISLNVLVFVALFPLGLRPAGADDPALLEYLRTLLAEGAARPDELRALAARVSAYDLVVFERGFRPGSPEATDVLTAMFLHGGFLHLAGNMLFLWIYGDNVEHRVGRIAYLALYLGTGAVAALGDGLLRPGSEIPSVGASGAISGVLGCYFVWFPRNRVRLWAWLFPFPPLEFELPARVVLGIYVAVDNLLPLLLTGGAGGVSYGAHLGGFLAGAGLAWALGRAPAGVDGELPRPGPTPTALELRATFHAALGGGRLDEAAGLLLRAPAGVLRAALSAADAAILGELLLRGGQQRTALAVHQRALVDHLPGPGRAAVRLGLARLLLARGQPTLAYQQVLAGLEEDPTAEDRERARELLGSIREQVGALPRHPGLL